MQMAVDYLSALDEKWILEKGGNVQALDKGW